MLTFTDKQDQYTELKIMKRIKKRNEKKIITYSIALIIRNVHINGDQLKVFLELNNLCSVLKKSKQIII